MRTKKADRGFVAVVEEKYQNKPGEFTRLMQESSAIGNYEDSFDIPGSSFLWIGQDHHLNREQIKQFIDHLQYWIDNKRLNVDDAKSSGKEPLQDIQIISPKRKGIKNMYQDRTGHAIEINDRVRFGGEFYTIKGFKPNSDRGLFEITFFEPQHIDEIACEANVDLIVQ